MATRKQRIVDAAKRHVMEDTATILGVDVAGQFKRPYVESGDTGGYRPVFFCASADIPAGAKKKTGVVIDSVNYTIAYMEPDGNGFTSIVLEKA